MFPVSISSASPAGVKSVSSAVFPAAEIFGICAVLVFESTHKNIGFWGLLVTSGSIQAMSYLLHWVKCRLIPRIFLKGLDFLEIIDFSSYQF
jgi:hypothetical protein